MFGSHLGTDREIVFAEQALALLGHHLPLFLDHGGVTQSVRRISKFCPLAEIFEVYAATVKEVDYAKYLAYAGLDLDAPAAPAAGASRWTESAPLHDRSTTRWHRASQTIGCDSSFRDAGA